MLRLFAPFLPFVTEEVWSWWQTGSVHQSAWPTRDELEALIVDGIAPQEDQAVYAWATEVLFEVRKQRSEAKQALKVPISAVTIKAEPENIGRLPLVDADLRSALRVKVFNASEGARAILVEGYDPV